MNNDRLMEAFKQCVRLLRPPEERYNRFKLLVCHAHLKLRIDFQQFTWSFYLQVRLFMYTSL